jgi:plastocyanin
MRRAGLALAATACLALPAAALAMDMGGGAGAQTARVSIAYISYSPAQVDVLTGDTVVWSNDSSREHTATADDGSWDSGHIPRGMTFTHTFTAAGTWAYHCTIHTVMHGEIDVHTLMLDRFPASAAPGRPFPISGRAALPPGTSLTIEGDSGSGFARVATAQVGPDGRFLASVTPSTSTTYRVSAGDAHSSPQLLVVFNRRLTLSHVRRGGRDIVTVTVTPASPGATVVLQLHLRERFGWWPERIRMLDRSSRASFSVSPRTQVSARVALTLADGATLLGLSRTVRIGPPPRRHR